MTYVQHQILRTLPLSEINSNENISNYIIISFNLASQNIST